MRKENKKNITFAPEIASSEIMSSETVSSETTVSELTVSENVKDSKK